MTERAKYTAGLAVIFVIAGMLGLASNVPYSGWVLAAGIFCAVAF